ncbi:MULTISPECIES: methyltransferase domain-containing protein [unclassified Prochlorococcus]|uniref:methyltransferase domain-containing protein n=1 Tax=unclassified Prochlorococcus TaxID=2627481 RepID=UPI00053386D4|nr:MULTISPECIES: methyltransferase domain-containing protein [unclassified Prochlorococcus]KGG14768.1 Biotin synthesis protein bioC [Prochlorococcus sp. MIT 0602]KGG15800.1 Biotin synthesis protein bioC [Prochlorococcus sp. MIT 0603]
MTIRKQNPIIKNFGQVSETYNKAAFLQTVFANKIAEQCSKQNVPQGLWLDLGSGTGLLADALEKIYTNQAVYRVDGSSNMLKQHPQNSLTKVFDLNAGLPKLIEPPTLIASSFALHWLKDPETRLKEWFSSLAPKGWLAIALPVQESFPEWHKAAIQANVKCTAIQFPCHTSLLKVITKENIKFQTIERITQEASSVTKLLKSFVHVGAHTSTSKSLKVSEWRRLQKSWPTSTKNHLHQLTWSIQILIAQK